MHVCMPMCVRMLVGMRVLCVCVCVCACVCVVRNTKQDLPLTLQ